MKINKRIYYDKVKACWIGKNIGGTMGTPYEGEREMQDITGFVTKPGEVLPNDDLDLQLVWLYAVRALGANNITSRTLGEFWCSFITPHWNEYGIGKANMKRGLYAPLSGDYKNSWRDSNGAWIRTEIWACLYPGCPELSARYAIADAGVDHGAGEGTVAAAFVAAVQSSAFCLGSIRECIEIGLEAIPPESRVASSVRRVLECYDSGMDYREARNTVQAMNADIGDGWFEAPSNVAYVAIGLLYGEGDFKKSMIYAINCGDDTDCTGATVGATLGILYGTAGVPSDWSEYIGDSIVTVSIARGDRARKLPSTCTELTDLVVAEAPHAIHLNGSRVELCDEESDPTSAEELARILRRDIASTLRSMKPFTTRFEAIPATAVVTLDRSPDIAPGAEIGISVRFENEWEKHENSPYDLALRWILPEGFSVEGAHSSLRLPQRSAHDPEPFVEERVTVRAGERVDHVNRIVLEVLFCGRPTDMYIPIVLLG